MTDLPPQSSGTGRAAICGFIAAACFVAAPLTMRSEGERFVGYYDPVRIPTGCFGHTGSDVHVGVRYAPAQCVKWFSQDQVRLTSAAASCLPDAIIQNRPVMASVSDAAFNMGPHTFCKSSMAKGFRIGKVALGCKAYGKYVYAGRPPRVLPGLVKRRTMEIKLCLEGVST